MADTTGALDRLGPMRVGILLAVLCILLGFGLGGAFGRYEEGIKGHLKAKAKAVRDSAYQGDSSAMKKVTGRSWGYLKRAHMHAGAIGTSALALSLLLSFFERSSRLVRGLTSAALGAGALGYSLFWLLAALRAPGMGGTGLAKESLSWLALPSAGLALAGLIAVLVLAVREALMRRRLPR